MYLTTYNHRVMKWNKCAKEGIVVAGEREKGSALTQLYYPQRLYRRYIKYNLCGQMHGMIVLSVLSANEAPSDKWVFPAAKCVLV